MNQYIVDVSKLPTPRVVVDTVEVFAQISPSNIPDIRLSTVNGVTIANIFAFVDTDPMPRLVNIPMPVALSIISDVGVAYCYKTVCTYRVGNTIWVVEYDKTLKTPNQYPIAHMVVEGDKNIPDWILAPTITPPYKRVVRESPC